MQDKILEQINNLVPAVVIPEKILLFGSRAGEEHTSRSDYDICIIVKNLQNERELIREINHHVYKSNIDVSIDFIAVDSDKYAKNSHKPGYIYKEIMENGVQIYGI